MWKKIEKNNVDNLNNSIEHNKINPLTLPGAKPVLVGFFFYISTEATTGLWCSSYLVNFKSISPNVAARWTAFFYAGITLGRFISGFLSIKISSKNMIRLGEIICVIGAIVLLLPIHNIFSLIGLVLIGLGCAPIFPAMLHDTPNRFGKEISSSIMGFQMAFAYIGSTTMPPVFGFMATKFGFIIFPFTLIIFILIMIMSSEKVNMNKNNLMI